MNTFLVSCSQFKTQLEEIIKEQSDVYILCKLPSIKYQSLYCLLKLECIIHLAMLTWIQSIKEL
jgi:hypothetical protein